MSLISSEVAPKVIGQNDSKIIFMVIDGLGGFPNESGKTELEAANTPNLDALAANGATGLIDTLGRGIVPGSGLAHLALFGYDPFVHDIGRGAIAANGIGITLKPNQIAARMNFCTEEAGKITDRRAGRIPTDQCAKLAEILNTEVNVPGVTIRVHAVMDYRAVVIFEGENLSIDVADTDSGVVGLPAKPVTATSEAGKETAKIVAEFVSQAKIALKDQSPANMVVLRGFAVQPDLDQMADCYKLNAACIATYPDYKGVARMIGMDILETGKEIVDEVDTLEHEWDNYNFFFFHVKKTDSLGEDGDFDGRVHKIEEVDALIPRLTALNPDVIVVTGDHSTPAVLSGHSWHPVPVLLSGETVRRDDTQCFGELESAKGALGRFDGPALMIDVLSHAGKTGKMGA
jgi:2,3-bisphosphoglycerate-independent phosphoglycerate mutase